jgi:antitoxin HicB
MKYPLVITKDDNDTYRVSFPDVPEAITFGDTKEEALVHAEEALLTAFDALMRNRSDIPAPSTRGSVFVELPALETTKIELYRAMRERAVGKAELAKRLDWHLPQVDRVLNVRHGSQLEQLEAAFGALGKRLVLTVVDAAEADRNRSVKGGQSVRRRAARPSVPGAIVTASLQKQAVTRQVTAGRSRSSTVRRTAKKR